MFINIRENALLWPSQTHENWGAVSPYTLQSCRTWLEALRTGKCFQYRLYIDYIDDSKLNLAKLGTTKHELIMLALQNCRHSRRHFEKTLSRLKRKKVSAETNQHIRGYESCLLHERALEPILHRETLRVQPDLHIVDEAA